MSDKQSIINITNKDQYTIEDRMKLAQYLKSIGGCPHIHKWHNPGYADDLQKCLDCGTEDI